MSSSPIYRSSPQGRSWPCGDAVFQVFLNVFRHVASLCFSCFSYFRYMFQLFHADVVKVDRDIAYVAMVVHIRCKCLSPMFHIYFLYTYVASVLDACLKCFICVIFSVASVASGCFKSRSGVASLSFLLSHLGVSSYRRRLASAAPLPLFSMLVMFGGGVGRCGYGKRL